MDLLTYNWLKRAMAGQLSMESYARTVKDKDHQMMIVHGDSHINKEAGIILAAGNPYIHQEVQDYIYDITKPYISSTIQYNGYMSITCKSPQDLDLLYALVKNPSLSTEVASKIIYNFSSLLKEIEKVKDTARRDIFSELYRQIKDKFHPVFYALSKSKVLDSSSASELINIFSNFGNHVEYLYYDKPGFSDFVDKSFSGLAGNTSIKKSERLKIANLYFNPTVVGGFIQSKDIDSDTIIGLIESVYSGIKNDNHKLENYIKTITSMVDSYNPQNEDLKKLHSFFMSDAFIDHFKNTISSSSSYNYGYIKRYDEKFFASLAKKTSSEEEKLSLLKRIIDPGQLLTSPSTSRDVSVHICEQLMSSGRVSEEFIDMLFSSYNLRNNFWHLLSKYPESNVHIFDKIYKKYVKDHNVYYYGAEYDWIAKCISIGISCESQKMLVDNFLERAKSYLLSFVGSYLYDDRFREFLTSNSGDNYALLLLKSGRVCPEVVKKLMSFHDGKARHTYIPIRLKQVKEKLANPNRTI